MADSPEKQRVDAYLNTVERLEPGITPIDHNAAAASVAISLKRIADSLGQIESILHDIRAWGIPSQKGRNFK